MPSQSVGCFCVRGEDQEGLCWKRAEDLPGAPPRLTWARLRGLRPLEGPSLSEEAPSLRGRCPAVQAGGCFSGAVGSWKGLKAPFIQFPYLTGEEIYMFPHLCFARVCHSILTKPSKTNTVTSSFGAGNEVPGTPRDLPVAT